MIVISKPPLIRYYIYYIYIYIIKQEKLSEREREREREREMEGENTNDLYRECLRNHAASLGSYATDGCGEFTLDEEASPGGLQCAACGCHRNFHRKVTYIATHHHHARGVSCSSRGRDPEATADLMDYSGGGGGGGGSRQVMVVESGDQGERSFGKKRFRTKFTPDQKEKMVGSYRGRI